MKRIKKILKRVRTREQFLKCVEEHYSVVSDEYRKIALAYDMMEHDFRGVYRDSGALYLTHLVAVAVILMEYLFVFELKLDGIEPWEVIVAALLHDSVEDLPELWTVKRVKLFFGYNVSLVVDYSSKPPKRLYPCKTRQRQVYHQRFINAPFAAILLKLSDRWHNQLTLWSCDREKVEYKLWETEAIYIPLARKYAILAHELEGTVRTLKKKLKKCA